MSEEEPRAGDAPCPAVAPPVAQPRGVCALPSPHPLAHWPYALQRQPTCSSAGAAAARPPSACRQACMGRGTGPKQSALAWPAAA